MPLTLTPAAVEALTGATVTDAQITLAADYIHTDTYRTVDEFVDVAGISESAVAAAWAIVAVRVASEVENGGDAFITSETQGDYSYSVDVARTARRADDLLEGVPRKLLRVGVGGWTRPLDRRDRDIFGDWWNDPDGWVQSRVVYTEG